MIALLYVLCYFVGAALTLRVLVLKGQDLVDRHQGRGRHSAQLMVVYGPQIIFGTMFWLFLTLGWGIWKLLFPRGVKSKYAREQERQTKLKEAKRKAEEEAERLRNLEQDVLAFGNDTGLVSDAQRLREDLDRVVGPGPIPEAMVHLADEIVSRYIDKQRQAHYKDGRE
jgi:hypothetical protein